MNRAILSIFFLGVIALSSAALPRITFKGSRMYDDKGAQFFCRGLAYAPAATSLTDSPLTNMTALTRDIKVFKQLSVNCIRVYQFFATSDIKPGMDALDAAGIYLIVDLYDPTDTINREFPIWTTDLFTVNKAKIDKLLPFSNVLGIIAGNEVTDAVLNSPASAYVKAAIRDVKAYIAQKGVAIPVGYAGADAQPIRDNLKQFLTCGTAAERADFYGINIYRWCGNGEVTFTSSTYNQLTADYSTLAIPALLTEFGCIVQGDPAQRFVREFTEIPTLFGSQMNGVFSGGIAYEYHTSGSALRPEGSYGIANYTAGEATAFLNVEGEYLAGQYRNVTTITGTQTQTEYTPTNTAPSCPAKSATWLVTPSPLPPTPDIKRCQCLANQFKCRTTIQNVSLVTADYGLKIQRVVSSLCGTNGTYCTSVASDSKVANYGTWSMCSSLVRASLLMNYVYQATGQCNFGEGTDFQTLILNPTTVASCTTDYPKDSADLSQIVVVPPTQVVDPGQDGGNVTPTNPAGSVSGNNGGNGSGNNGGNGSGTATSSAPVIAIGSALAIALIASI